MSELESAIERARELARNPIATYDQFPDSDAQLFRVPELEDLRRLARNATPEQGNAIVRGLVPAVREADPFQAARLALLCGSLVESGADPTIAVDAVVDRLPGVLAGAAVALERLGEGDDPDALFAADPEAVKSWKALRYLVLPAMAMLARDAAARQRARDRSELRDALKVIAPHETDARFLAMTLDLADGLELLVIHPRQGKGFRVGLEAVAGNGHLFTLLQGTLIGSPKAGLLEGPPPNVEVVGVATGQIVPEKHVGDKALFHYYDWSALDSDPESDELHLSATVWVDGRPEEIPEFEGTRVLLLGRPVFGFRGWDSTHFPLFHDALRPRVRLLGSLTPDEVADRLTRMRDAVRAAGV